MATKKQSGTNRKNIAFLFTAYPDVHAYIKQQARLRYMTMNQYLNKIVREHRGALKEPKP